MGFNWAFKGLSTSYKEHIKLLSEDLY